ncbi:MAG: GNAT family N-acetyltransferase [Candidatus Gracilibacteria bacterium]|nr:GNAT family N-acetyltransferase [Candidatus Gracilibacteria bacterium]
MDKEKNNGYTEILLAKEVDLQGIIDLQRKNLAFIVSDETKENDGFVSIETNIDLLSDISNDIGIIVAKYKKKVIGYLFAVTVGISKKMPILDKFVEDIGQYEYMGKNVDKYRYCILGQICIDNEHRGMGIFEKLYASFIDNLKGDYDIGIGGICSNNPRSLHVHMKKLGLEVVSEYSEGGKQWYIVVLDFKKILFI